MRRIFIDIADEAFDVLAHLALRERRNVRSQAAVLLEKATASSAGIDRRWRNGVPYDPSALQSPTESNAARQTVPA